MLQRLLLIAVAGGCGALARYGLGGLVYRVTGESFPWGTVVVNIVGCLAFGIVASLAGERGLVGPETRIILLAGFMGAFTTFSTYMYETDTLLRESQYLAAIGNLAVQNVLGFVAMIGGLALGRLI